MKIKLLFAFILVVNFCSAQTGNYFISQFTPDDERFDYVTFAMAQDEKGVIYFANKRGVLEFDGRNWGLISTPGPVFTITTVGHEVFAGGYNGFGKLTIGPDNSKLFQPLSQNQKGASQIFSSLSLNNKVYFSNTSAVFILSSEGNIETTLKAKQGEEFDGLFNIAGKVYVKTNSDFYKIDNNKLVAPSFPWTDKLSIDFAATSNSVDPMTLLSVSGGRLFLASTSGLKEIILTQKDFIQQNVVVAVAWLSDELIAVGTMHGGVIFINPQTGATQEISNFYTGLPDNEVLTLFTDRNQGLWVAHGYGFSRIAPHVPFKSYNHFPGLEGNLLCVKTFQGQTYVGTSLGLFCLAKQEVVEETILPVSQKKESKAKKGFFSFLKRNSVSNNAAPSVKRTIKSLGYVYKRVDGILGKVTQLLEVDNQLLAIGDFGISSVDNLKSVIISTQPVRTAFKSKALQQLLVSTLDDQIESFSPSAKGWQQTQLLDTLQDFVSYIFEDKLQNVWLCGRTSAIKIETVDGEITSVETVPFSNPTVDESVGLAYGSEVYIATGESFHRYDIKENVFKKYDSLPGPKKYFASAGYFWFHDGHRWRTVDPRVQAALKLQWLGLFPNMRYIAPAEDETLWVITAENELYKFSGKQDDRIPNVYPLFLREVRGQENKLSASRSIIVSQLESTVSFEFIQPDFLGMKAVEYRYQVKGQSSDWTPWATTNNIVNFSYLPAGKYKLDVQTRDLMGKISPVEEITLEVEPPYWKRPWFYLLEVIFFGALVFLSMKLSAGNTKYRLLSQLLSMLTVIMIIQLVTASVGAFITVKASPVLDFFVQVGIALLVLPVENSLRRFMFRQRATHKS